MNKAEASTVLGAQLAGWRTKPYSSLVASIGTPVCVKVAAPSGRQYQVEIEVSWDDRPAGNVRVIGAVDDGGFRALVPLSGSFIMAPTGQLVSEDP